MFHLESSLLISPEKTMKIVLDAIQDIIPYELAVILSYEPNNILQVRYASGPLSNDSLLKYKIPVDKRPDMLRALELGEVKLVKETENPEHHDTYEDIVELPVGHSCLLAPLRLNGETIGLMTLDHSKCEMFTPERVNVARTLSKLITIALAQSLETTFLQRENEALLYERNSLIGDLKELSDSMVGNSRVWQQVMEKVKLVAPTESHVMILGETGTGKEQVAKAIHALSGRSSKPFITLNCSAINQNLAESELFGHEKGAFTGAVGPRKGRFELADGGVLFLDELGDLPAEIQPKLLRAIQQGTFERLGSEKTLTANVRIISATNANLAEKVRTGGFREDLYYRLNVFPIDLPPLRNRREDVILLAHHFVKQLRPKFGYKNTSLSEQAVIELMANDWPGNVRQLQNTIERALINCRGFEIRPQHIFLEKLSVPNHEADQKPFVATQNFDDAVKGIISAALQSSGGKIYGEDGAAKKLGLKPTTLQSKMKKLGIS